MNSKSLEELQRYILENKIQLPENFKNKRYLIRAIEKSASVKREDCKKVNKYNAIVVGITTPHNELRQRIFQRNELFFSSGIIEEFKKNEQKYGMDSEAATANAYPLVQKYLAGELTQQELIEKMSVRDWRLAKRQITFMKRNKDIIWLNLKDAEQFIISKIKK